MHDCILFLEHVGCTCCCGVALQVLKSAESPHGYAQKGKQIGQFSIHLNFPSLSPATTTLGLRLSLAVGVIRLQLPLPDSDRPRHGGVF